MPPLPMNARSSSCGNMRAISSRLGGWNGAVSGWEEVSAAAPCLSRHAGQSPPSAPVGNVAPHCGHLFSILGSVSGSFILLPQKQNPENVTGFRGKFWQNLVLANTAPQGDFASNPFNAPACQKLVPELPRALAES